MDYFTNTLFIFLTIAAILSQIPHAWYVFDSFSKLNKWLKISQSLLFCSILSVAILGFVLTGQTTLAIFGAFIETVINIYYYTLDFWKNGINKRTSETRKKAIAIFWRKNWIKIFFSVLLPLLIFIFSEQLKK